MQHEQEAVGRCERKTKEKVETSERVQVFIPRESGGLGDAERLVRGSQAKPERAALDLEAGKGAHFTRTDIIFKDFY